MDLDDQLKLGHLLLYERECRTCGETKNLVDGFYRTRKDRGPVAASYSYECKECTKKRVKKSNNTWEYPDWQISRLDSPFKSVFLINNFRNILDQGDRKDASKLSISWNCSKRS